MGDGRDVRGLRLSGGRRGGRGLRGLRRGGGQNHPDKKRQGKRKRAGTPVRGANHVLHDCPPKEPSRNPGEIRSKGTVVRMKLTPATSAESCESNRVASQSP